MVIHSHVVAHQVFALRLISWLDSVLAYSEGFRALFSRILIEQEVGPTGRKQPSLLENILKHDTVLWKSARSAVHHLLISGSVASLVTIIDAQILKCFPEKIVDLKYLRNVVGAREQERFCNCLHQQLWNNNERLY